MYIFGTSDMQKQALLCDKLSTITGVGYSDKNECKRLAKEIRSRHQINVSDQKFLENLYSRFRSQCR